MDQKNDTLDDEDVVFMLLETLKSNGTFDEIRRHCVTDIDAKPTYQNWKQRIESNVNKFLSKVKFTPELNKNSVRERLRKHLLDGRENQDIEEGADRILTQVLAPRSLSIFEPKIAVAVDEYLGIKNEAPPIELNGLKESTINLIKSSNIEISTVFNPKIDFISDADNITYDTTLKDEIKDLRSDKTEKPSSLCKEPKSLNGNQSEDENDTGGSLKQKSSQHKNKTSTSDKSKSSSSNHKSSKKDNSCKEVVEKSKDVINKPKDIFNKSKDVSKPKDIVEKSKDIVNKLKDVSKPKDIVDKSKDIVNKPKDIVEKSKDNVNKPKDIVDKSKEKSFSSKNSNSKSSSHKSNRTDSKRTKRSLEEKKKSSSLCKEPKLLNGNRSDDESNSGGSSKHKSTIHKNKSSSTNKTKSSSSNHKSSRRDNNSTDVVDKSKDKSLSKNSSSADIAHKSKDKSSSKISNRTVDKSKDKYSSMSLSSTDADKSKDKYLSKKSTSSDIDKSKKRSLSKNSSSTDVTDKSKNKSLSKNSSSTGITDKSKIKSSSTKNSRCTDVVEKSKDKSFSKNSSSSSHKSNLIDTKRLKLSQEEKNKSPTNKVNDEERKLDDEPEEPEKSEWNDFRSSIMTNDEQDAANVLLSMSAISYESSHSEIITENIIFIGNSSPIAETLQTTETVNELEIKENSDETKNLPPGDNDDIKENSQLKSNNLETTQSQNAVKSSSNISHLFEKVCSVDIERLPCNDIKLQCSSVNNVETTEEHQKPAEVEDKNELKILNIGINLETSENENTSEYNSNDVLKVPKLTLKLLPNQIDSLNKTKRKKHHKHKESKKLKLSKSSDIHDEVSTNMCDKIDQKSDSEIDQKSDNEIDQKSNNDVDIIINDSPSTSSNQIFHDEIENNSTNILDVEESLNTFKGFSEADAIPCKNYRLLKSVIKTLQAQINRNTIDDGFKGFTSAETKPCKYRDNVHAELIKLKESESSTGFIGFTEEDTRMTIGHKYVVRHLSFAKANAKTYDDELMDAYLYKSDNDNDAESKKNYSEPIDDTKKDSPTVNNNNHDHDNWVAEQEMKYKLLPVKVKLERLMEFGCNNVKRVSDSPQVPI